METQNPDTYRYPSLAFLDLPPEGTPINLAAPDHQKQQIVALLERYGTRLAAIRAHIGPPAVCCELRPAPGVRIAQLKAVEKDLALVMAAPVRLTGQIPGTSSAGLEVSYPMPYRTCLRPILSSPEFQQHNGELPLAVGLDMAGKTARLCRSAPGF